MLRRSLAAVAATACLAVTAGCGLGTAAGFSPSGKLDGPVQDVDLGGASVSVGSKNFTEQLVLGKIAVILLQSAGADVTDLTNIPGSASARYAQIDGQVDMEWEYTGTAWISYLGHTKPIPDEQKQYEAVRDEELKKNDLVWAKPAPMNNTYGFATPAETLKKLGITKLSEIADLPVDQRTFCVESEFKNRNDGFQPMLEKYDLPLGKEVPQGNVKTLATGAIYAATDKGECNFGEIFTTDGRIKALDLTVLEDDRQFFPKYNVATVFRKEVLDQHPELKDLFAPVSAKLDDKTLIELNAQVDVDGRDPVDVAHDWLKKEGFLAS
ncbi:glycine betaine ABC transporter substrate-binding protein [Nocardioides iriomotensis]|uniref:Glycine betaine ABC transporter substrate-binding protein n=1 Tax=Nocardioides iriomotensis TaxID=715784 RepID=A0A4Q5J5G7_9ACTN|nr:glycine betaine ABC transporter substrate-binding protein [Nocardioides iriomotensis]RYU13877.1 glycine betaine ABC transporter substrate-binding protein [Nocardioides iriomotensis]